MTWAAICTWLVCFCLLHIEVVNTARYTFVDQHLSKLYYDEGIANLDTGLSEAFSNFKRSFDAFPTIVAGDYIVWILDLLGKKNDAEEATKLYLERFQINDTALMQGSQHSFRKEHAEALACYAAYVQAYPQRAEGWFQVGATHQALGNIGESVRFYQQALRCNKIHTKSMVNLAGVYQYGGRLQLASELYEKVLALVVRSRQLMVGYTFMHSDYVKATSNLVMVYYQQGILRKALATVRAAQEELSSLLSSFPALTSDSTPDHRISYKLTQDAVMGFVGHRLLVQRAAADWQDREALLKKLLQHELTTSTGDAAVIWPFDSLLYELSLQDRLSIATKAVSSLLPPPLPPQQTSSVASADRPLRIAFMTLDISNHPTAHLLEGLMHLLRMQSACNGRAKQAELVVFSFGPPNNSTYFRSIQALADEFHDFSMLLSRAELAHAVFSKDVDILLDMQVFSFGHQMEVIAAHPAHVITMNYLVYPGTSGGKVLDYIIADHVVVPAEHAQWYGERLLLLPASYQPSYYGHILHQHGSFIDSTGVSGTLLLSIRTLKVSLREKHGLPAAGIILCNFNKVDKIDPTSFALWMQVMKRLPNSYLWMLRPSFGGSDGGSAKQPSDYVTFMERRFNMSFAHLGISPDRMIFAKWAEKKEHIERHLAADLFLDTVIYSAHSTATDALYGGLPVLTLRGDSFGNRVVASLLNSFQDASILWESMLAVDSVKDFESHAIRLLSTAVEGQLLVHTMQLHLVQHIVTQQVSEPWADTGVVSHCGLKKDAERAQYFLAAMLASKEVKQMNNQKALPHLVVVSQAQQ